MKSLSPTNAGSFGHFLKRCDLRLVALLVVVVLLFVAQGLAQEATIVGTVTDPSGAAVPNVSITVTNTDTGITRTLTTSGDGQFVVPDLGIGHYSVKATASGFKVAEQSNIVLAVNDRTRVDFKLQVGSAQEQVTVEAAAIAVQSDTGEVSDLITGQQIAQLATNGRSMYSLISLTPGASSGQGDFQIPTPVGGDANVSFNGMRMSHNLYLLDGSESSDRGGAGGSDVMPSLDSIAEFREMTSNYSAEYGLSSSATMTAVIKSGTKQYHASAWEFLRNDALDARNYFNPSPQKVAELRFHTFGFNVGGPVDFWKKEHKTFFFYNMEWRRLIQGQTLTQTVPDTAWYGGDVAGGPAPTVPSAANVSAAYLFRNCPGGAAPAGIVQGSPFPNNTIPSCMIDPNSTALLQAGIFPANNAVNGSGNPEFQGGNNVPTTVKEEIVRIDHQFNSKFSVYGHYLREQIAQNFGTSMWSGDNVPTASNTFGNPSYSYVVHTTYVISPTLLNEVAYNQNGNKIAILPSNLIARPSGFTSNRIFGGPNNDNRIPEIHLAGYNNTDYTNASWPWNNKADDYQIRDDLSWTKGAHQLKMGGSWALYKKVQDLFGNTQGSFTFDGHLTGNDFADYLLGLSNSYTELGVQDHGFWNNVSWALYVQDNWRVNKRLTLNLGLRWDGVPHTYEANNRMGNFYPNLYDQAQAAVFDSNGNICGGAFDPVTGANPGCTAASPGLGTSPNPVLAGYQFYLNGIGIPGKTPGVPKGLVNTQWAAFGPRIGFAYDLTGSGKTVLRGGFGAMYERIQGNDMYNAGPNVPFSTSVSYNNVSLSNTAISTLTGIQNVAPVTVAGITGLAVDDYKLPVAYQYSIGVQRSLSSKTVLGISYVGNQSRHQNDYRNINLPDESNLPALINGTVPGGVNTIAPYKGFGTINMAVNEANAHYNGLQMDLNSQVTRDLTLRAYYTLSRSIDPTTGGSGGGDLGTVSNPYAGWKYDNGPSGYDRTHVFSANFIYEIPLFRNNSSRAIKTTLGGWEVSGIVVAETGLPLNVTLTGSQGGNGIGGTNRPDLTGSISYPKSVNEWFDTSAFSAPALGAWGNLGHNALRGPGRQNWDLSLFKNFVFSEARGSQLELRLETFNTFNHTQFQNVSTGVGSSNFGQVTSAFPARILQLGAKISF